MDMNNANEPLKVGTFAKILNSGYARAQIVEYRGPLGPCGARIYRLCVRRKPRPAYVEVREDQLEILPEGGTITIAPRITLDPTICHGKPCIRGLRYTVSLILELLASGMSQDEILADYPDLEKEDILACLQYAAQLSKVKSVVRANP
jgi:uncharacterized protein (DUF433 family)